MAADLNSGLSYLIITVTTPSRFMITDSKDWFCSFMIEKSAIYHLKLLPCKYYLTTTVKFVVLMLTRLTNNALQMGVVYKS
jgi:hypothetical protein